MPWKYFRLFMYKLQNTFVTFDVQSHVIYFFIWLSELKSMLPSKSQTNASGSLYQPKNICVTILNLVLSRLSSTARRCGPWIRTSPSRSSSPSSSRSSSSSTTGLCMTLWPGPLLSSAEGPGSLSSGRDSCSRVGTWWKRSYEPTCAECL